MLRELISERSKVAECMTWCIDHAEAADEVMAAFLELWTWTGELMEQELRYCSALVNVEWGSWASPNDVMPAVYSCPFDGWKLYSWHRMHTVYTVFVGARRCFLSSVMLYVYRHKFTTSQQQERSIEIEIFLYTGTARQYMCFNWVWWTVLRGVWNLTVNK